PYHRGTVLFVGHSVVPGGTRLVSASPLGMAAGCGGDLDQSRRRCVQHVQRRIDERRRRSTYCGVVVGVYDAATHAEVLPLRLCFTSRRTKRRFPSWTFVSFVVKAFVSLA